MTGIAKIIPSIADTPREAAPAGTGGGGGGGGTTGRTKGDVPGSTTGDTSFNPYGSVKPVE
jgi:hypothetical protein